MADELKRYAAAGDTVIGDIPEFGLSESSVDYILRPGGYALVFDTSGRLAVVSTGKGLHLPGGGVEVGESVEDAAIRETAEESGLIVSLLERIGIADQLVHSDAVFYRKRCTFFRAVVIGTAESHERDHQLIWLSPEIAAQQLRHESHRWAVRRAL